MTGLDLTKEWFRHASDELICAHHVFENMYPKQVEICCYLCQQSAEKALKGYLTHFTHEEPPYTHDLKALCALCISVDAAFNSILAYSTDLTKFATTTRYPGNEMLIDEPMAKAALSKADAVYNFCLSKIPEVQPE